MRPPGRVVNPGGSGSREVAHVTPPSAVRQMDGALFGSYDVMYPRCASTNERFSLH